MGDDACPTWGRNRDFGRPNLQGKSLCGASGIGGRLAGVKGEGGGALGAVTWSRRQCSAGERLI